MKTKLSRILACVLVLVLACSLFTGCGKSSASEEPAESIDKSQLRFQIYGEPSSLDMHSCSEMIAQTIDQSLYAGLLQFDADGNVVGDLAEDWSWNDDYTQITLNLRDAKFSDGSAITSEDVKFSFERGAEIGFSSYFAFIDSIETPDEKTVVINLTQSYAVFECTLCLSYFAVYSKAALDAGMDPAKEASVTSGAYYIDSWNTGEDILLKANENYWAGVAPIPTVDLVVLGDENTALIAFEAGEIDFMTGSTALSGTSVDAINEMEGAELCPFSSANMNFLILNHDVEYFADENVRKAIDCAIDRDSVIAAALDGSGEAASIPIQKGMGGYIDGYSATAYDVEAAKEYLAKSNYPDGFSFSIMSAMPAWKKAATVIQANLADVGITVEINEVEAGVALTATGTGDFEAMIMSWANPSNDISNVNPMYIVGDALNMANHKETKIGELMLQADGQTGEARSASLKEAYDLMMDKVPYVSLYWPITYYGMNSNLSIAKPIGPVGYNFYDISWK